MNPLDLTGQEFSLSLMNPNPKAARLKDGPRYRVEFEVDQETFDQFMSARELSGMVIECRAEVSAVNEPANESAQAQPAPAKRAPEVATERTATTVTASAAARVQTLAQRMHIDGYWRNPRLWAAMDAAGIYSQKQHKAWIESQPCIGLKYNYNGRVPIDHACTGDICAHHTPSAALPAAGKGSDNPRKPPYWYTVPACHVFHAWCHSSTGAEREDKQRLVELAVQLTADRMKEHMKIYIGVESSRELTPEIVDTFEREIGLKAA